MTATQDASHDAFGQRLLRKEDPPLLTGEARFVDDLAVPGALWFSVVRSQFANATIRSIDKSDAEGMDGVVAIFTGEDLRDEWASGLPCAWPVTDDMRAPEHLPVAVGAVRHVGDPVAVVVAGTREQASDATHAVMVDLDPLPAVTDLAAAARDEVVVHPDLGTNVSYTWVLEPQGDEVARAFEQAAHVVRERYVQQRLIPAAMEPRGVVAVPSPQGGDFTLYSSTQVPHILKVMLSLTLGIDENSIRVIAPKVGGGFGSKLQVYPEEALALGLARRLGRPVRWTETRSEASVATHQGRAQIQEIELAADAEGHITAVRANIVADMGAYLGIITPGTPLLGAFLYHGCYDIPNYSFTCRGVFTNATMTDAYRGAGRPEATYAIERSIDALAREMSLDPAELRRRNLIRPEQFPYESCAGLVFDSGDYLTVLGMALDRAGYDDLRKEQARRREAHDPKQLGIGLSSYVEMCGLAPSRILASLNYAAGGWESATVRIKPTGVVEVVTGTTPHGQGHETSWSQIVASRLGIDPASVRVLHSDTQVSPYGMDTYGSRSLSVGGTAVWHATEKVIAKAKAVAAHQLEASPADIELSGGVFSVRGSPEAAVELGDVAFAAFTAHDLPEDVEPNLEATAHWDPPNFTFPNGTHVAVVEIDTETGAVDLVRYVAVDDCGNQVNPMIVEGQIHGGIAQGVGQALWEGAIYDADGNPRTTTLAEYLVPSAAELPDFELDHTATPSPTNPMGVKGIGEAGTIASTPAVINAVVDALGPYGVTDIEMPASPERVWRAMQGGEP